MTSSRFHVVAKIAVILAFIVVMLGAYTRLGDAGLGCPDWPGCYGKLVLPENTLGLEHAQQAFPAIPIQPHKAWKEMVHRYFAGTLGILIFVLAIWATKRRRVDLKQPIVLPWFIAGFVVLQAAFGMWTVTWKLLPAVVTAHLLGGMLLASLLCWLALSTRHQRKRLIPFWADNSALRPLRKWAMLGLIILSIQIFLGAWTSTNYAALACSTFPDCHGSFFPHMEWIRAFDLWHPIGPNYEGGLLDKAARSTIQMTHRYGACITFIYLLGLILVIFSKDKFKPLYKLTSFILILLIAQVVLGILNVVLLLPIDNAVAHNGVAVLLLLSVLSLVYRTSRKTD